MVMPARRRPPRNRVATALVLAGLSLTVLLQPTKATAQPLPDQLEEAAKQLVGTLLVALDDPNDADPPEKLFVAGADLRPVDSSARGLDAFHQRLNAFAGGTHKLRGVEVTQSDDGKELVITAIVDWKKETPGEPSEAARFGIEIVAIPANDLSTMAIKAWSEKYLTPSDSLGVKLFC